MKIISTLSTEEIESRIGYNWEYWNIYEENNCFKLNKSEDKE